MGKFLKRDMVMQNLHEGEVYRLSLFEEQGILVDTNLPLKLLTDDILIKDDFDFVATDNVKVNSDWFEDKNFKIEYLTFNDLLNLIEKPNTSFKLQTTFRLELIKNIMLSTNGEKVFMIMFYKGEPFYGIMLNYLVPKEAMIILILDENDSNAFSYMMYQLTCSNRKVTVHLCKDSYIETEEFENLIPSKPRLEPNSYYMSLSTTSELRSINKLMINDEDLRISVYENAILTVGITDKHADEVKHLVIMSTANVADVVGEDNASFIQAKEMTNMFVVNHIEDSNDLANLVKVIFKRISTMENKTVHFANLSDLNDLAADAGYKTLEVSKTSSITYE